ncbi:MAG: hypothetical protein DCC67_14505 [Planctomycetota bacterium]|nr:MAG: hypothetical protein DCC67_14505 [Planctomycetota bacterium]
MNNAPHHFRATVTAAALAALCGVGLACAEPAKRAKPPTWTPEDLDAFLDDARQALVGPRPDRRSPSDDKQAPLAGPQSSAAGQPPAGDVAWSQLIDGDTLADEVKRLAASLQEPLSSPAAFKSGGHQQCRSALNLLAVLFAAIAEYDGDVRWQADAAPLRDRLARAAANCKVAADQALAEAAQRMAELDDLVRGQPLGLPPAPAVDDWSTLADRSLLMERMEQSLDERLAPALATSRELTRRAADVAHEAQVLALLAHVIQREAFDNWDDPAFRQHAHNLQDAATELKRAAEEIDHPAAQAALNRIEQSCANCHADFRG